MIRAYVAYGAFYGGVLFCLSVFVFLGLILVRDGVRRCAERRANGDGGAST